MKEWHIKNINDIELVEKVCPRQEGQVKLRMSKIILSSTSIAHFANSDDMPTSIAGHAAVAHVSEADEDSGLNLGDRVVVSPFIKVREHGIETVKTMGVDVDGLLRDFVCVPQENVFVLPDGVSDEDAVFAAYIAMGSRVFEAFENDKGDYVVIIGAGTTGLMLAQLATYYQMVPIIVDLDEDKLALAQKWGIAYALNPTFENLERRVEEITGGRMAEAAIYAGEGIGINSAIRLVKSEGDVIIAGFASYEKHQIDTHTILKKQIKLKGVCNGFGEMPFAINLLANRIIKTDGLITAQANFDEIPQVVENCVKYPYQYSKILVNND